MKYLKFILAILFIFIFNKAYAADFIATQTFTTQANDTVQIDSSGQRTATIDGMTGNLGGNLSVNFNSTESIEEKEKVNKSLFFFFILETRCVD